MKFETLAAFGAYESQWQASITNAYHFTMLSLAYDIPAIHTTVRAVYTNATPVDAYRGAGRPEAVYQVERMIENGAQEMGIDPLELRARNLIPPEKFPYQTALGITYDSGDPPALMWRRPRRSAITMRSAPSRRRSGRKASGWASASRRSSTWRAPARSR